MSSFKSTDIPYSRLCQEPDENHENINFEQWNSFNLNELDVINQPDEYNLQNHSLIHGTQSVTGNIITEQKDFQYYGHHCNQIMHDTISQQSQHEHQLQTNEPIIDQSYLSLNQSHFHYPRTYDQNTDPDLHLYHHTQVYPQQQMQSPCYYHINPLNSFNDNLNRFVLSFIKKNMTIKQKTKNKKKTIKKCAIKSLIKKKKKKTYDNNNVGFLSIKMGT